jgi:hypothetical protein
MTQAEAEYNHSRDRLALRECLERHGALREYYRLRDAALRGD